MASRALKTDPRMEAATGNDLEAHTYNVDESLVRNRAYELWEARGCPYGSDQEDWFSAEQELRQQPV
jgi:hypothetical protein